MGNRGAQRLSRRLESARQLHSSSSFRVGLRAFGVFSASIGRQFSREESLARLLCVISLSVPSPGSHFSGSLCAVMARQLSLFCKVLVGHVARVPRPITRRPNTCRALAPARVERSVPAWLEVWLALETPRTGLRSRVNKGLDMGGAVDCLGDARGKVGAERCRCTPFLACHAVARFAGSFSLAGRFSLTGRFSLAGQFGLARLSPWGWLAHICGRSI